MIRVYRRKVAKVLGRSWIADYCVNPYIGCSHGCLYCYASYYTSKFYKTEEEWGSYVVIKENSPEVLARELKKKPTGTVYLSSLTDPYQPIEREERISRRILEVLFSEGWPAIVHTKSDLVLRDLDMISCGGFVLGVTIISLDPYISKSFEPRAPPPSRRIEVLKKAKETGIKTYAFLGPILPETEIGEVKELIKAVKGFSDEIYVDKFSYKPGMEKMLERVLGEDWKIWKRISEDRKGYYSKLKEEVLRLGVKVLYREYQGVSSSSPYEKQNVFYRVPFPFSFFLYSPEESRIVPHEQSHLSSSFKVSLCFFEKFN